jgi:four helix bundle protein
VNEAKRQSNYADWERAVSPGIKADSLWRMKAYRFALFLDDLCWHDTAKLLKVPRMLGIADPLARATGSIGANLAEGYSRGTGRDRARFYEYSLGSARESRHWYYKVRYVLGEAVYQHREQILAKIIRLLLTMIPDQRQRVLKEVEITYEAELDLERIPYA